MVFWRHKEGVCESACFTSTLLGLPLVPQQVGLAGSAGESRDVVRAMMLAVFLIFLFLNVCQLPRGGRIANVGVLLHLGLLLCVVAVPSPSAAKATAALVQMITNSTSCGRRGDWA